MKKKQPHTPSDSETRASETREALIAATKKREGIATRLSELKHQLETLLQADEPDAAAIASAQAGVQAHTLLRDRAQAAEETAQEDFATAMSKVQRHCSARVNRAIGAIIESVEDELAALGPWHNGFNSIERPVKELAESWQPARDLRRLLIPGHTFVSHLRRAEGWAAFERFEKFIGKVESAKNCREAKRLIAEIREEAANG